MKILITDGDNRASLAIVRSLGKHGHSIIVSNKHFPSLASVSRFCSEHFLYPDPVSKPQEFVTAIIKYINDNNIDIVLPVADVTTLLLAKNRGQLPASCNFPFSDFETISLAADKDYIMKLAQALNVPIPTTFELESKAEIPNLPDDLSYPIVLKPARSRIKTEHGWHFTAVSYADNHADLVNALEHKNELEFPILLQERIYGPGVGVFMCCNQGDVIAAFSHRRLREKPPSGGVSVLRESIEIDPNARKYAEALLKKLNWHGVAMVEFKLDNKDQEAKLMEINGRFWGSLQLAIDSGVDFPALLISTTQNDNIQPVLKYKLGVKSRWFWGDLDSLLMLFLKSKKELQLPKGSDSTFKTFLQFCKLWEPNMRYEVLSFQDIRPWLLETRRWFIKK